MSLLKSVQTKEGISTKESDSLGGGNVVDSGVYLQKITAAYLGQARSGAISVTIELANKVATTFYITSGKEKGNLPYYVKDGVEHYLPGFLTMNSLAELVTGKGITALDTEEKTIKKYDYESKSELPTKVEMLVDLVGVDINAAILKQKVSKKVKTDKGYEPTAETREVNEIVKFFNEDGLSHTEKQAGVAVSEATAMAKWAEKFSGQVIDKTEKPTAAAAATSGSAGVGATASTAAAAPVDDLFADKP